MMSNLLFLFVTNKYTYPIALGSSSANHEEVEKRLATELDELRNPGNTANVFYSKIHNADVRVHAVITCSLMDQPERRGSNGMMAGNSLYAARWGYSINLQAVCKKIVPCETCETLLLEKCTTWDLTPCSLCAQWKMIRDDDFLCWKAPDGFPKCSESKGGVLKPMKLEYDDLIRATNEAHRCVLSGDWTKTQAEQYLSYYCVNKKTASLIINCAQNMRAFHKLSTQKGSASGDDDYEALLRRQERFPHEFQQWKCPSLWTRGLPMSTQIDVPMHLIFLGAVQNVIGFIHVFLRKHEKYANFMRLSESRLSALVKIKVPWLQILPYKGDKLGGWVSENYVSFVRVCRWFYLILADLPPDDDPFEEPEGPQKDWRAYENRGWLKSRGLPTSGLAAELKERVREAMASGDVPLVPPPGGTTEDLYSLISSMYDMVKSVMVFEVTDHLVELADFEIKRFLTNLVSCERKLNPEAEKPVWISAFTFPCLLNLPAHMKEFGPLKNLWEGGVRGEGSLRFIKPKHGTIGLRKDWEPQVMHKIHLGRGLRSVGTGAITEELFDDGDNDDDDNGDVEEQSTDDVTANVWRYSSAEDVYQDFKSQAALCLACDMNGVYGAMLRSGKVVRFTCDLDGKKDVHMGVEYFLWKPVVDHLCDSIRGFELIQAEDFDLKFACVLLPIGYNNRVTLYAAIREDYTVFTHSGEYR